MTILLQFLDKNMTFSFAAFIGATSLAGVFLSAPAAAEHGDGWCGIPCDDDDWCCHCFDGELGDCVEGTYDCEDDKIDTGSFVATFALSVKV